MKWLEETLDSFFFKIFSTALDAVEAKASIGAFTYWDPEAHFSKSSRSPVSKSNCFLE